MKVLQKNIREVDALRRLCWRRAQILYMFHNTKEVAAAFSKMNELMHTRVWLVTSLDRTQAEFSKQLEGYRKT